MVPGRRKLIGLPAGPSHCWEVPVHPDHWGGPGDPPSRAPPSPCSTPVWRVLPGRLDRNLWWELSRKGVRAAGTFLHRGHDIARYTKVMQVAGRPFQMVVCAEKDTGHGEAGDDRW